MQTMTYEQRVEVTQRIIAVLDDWGVTDSDQIKLLALPEGTRSRVIRSYRNETPLPEDETVFERVEHFAGIAHALWTSNPRNSQAGALWMNRACEHFYKRTPLQVMLEDDLDGIEAVRVHIDCSYDWHVNGK
jgi:hypothetical protein